MGKILPILFNTEMVQAILDGRKTVTRRVVKPQPIEGHFSYVYQSNNVHIRTESGDIKAPYQPGDILYVRETWYKNSYRYMYRADYNENEKFYQNGKEIQIKWHPSIHMSKEAARIFLKITNVRLEQLQDISKDTPGPDNQVVKEGFRYESDFAASWNSTIKKSDINQYGWYANPWVWVIEFERCDKPF